MEQLLALPEVEKITALKKSTIYRLISDKKFPSGIRIASRTRRWPYSHIQSWINQQINGEAA